MSNKAQAVRQCVDIYYSHPGKNLDETLAKIAFAAYGEGQSASQADHDAQLRAANERIAALTEALKLAEAALSDIGDADREPGDDLAWCEARAAQDLNVIRAALATNQDKPSLQPSGASQ